MNRFIKIAMILLMTGMAAVMPSSAHAANQTWSGGTSGNIGDATNWTPGAPLAADDWLWINVDGTESPNNPPYKPVIDVGAEYGATVGFIRVGVFENGNGLDHAGAVLQNGGTLEYSGELNVGYSSITSGIRSVYTMTGGTLRATGNTRDYIGQGKTGDVIGKGEMNILGGYATYDHTAGEIVMFGANGGDGILNMTANSTGGCTLISTGGVQFGNSGGAVGEGTLTGDSTMGYQALISGGTIRVGCWDGYGTLTMNHDSSITVSGLYVGSIASNGTFNMHGNAAAYLGTGTAGFADGGGLDIGNGIANVTMDGTSNIMAGEFNVGRTGGNATLGIGGTAQVYASGPYNIGANGGTANVTMTGGKITSTGNGSWIAVLGSAQATVNMSGNAALESGSYGGYWTTVGHETGSKGTISMQDTANITTYSGVRLGSGGGIAEVTMGRSGVLTDTPTWINGGSTAGYDSRFLLATSGTATLNMYGKSSIESTADVMVGSDTNGDGTLNMYDKSKITVTGAAFEVGNYSGKGTFSMGESNVISAANYRFGTDGGNSRVTMTGGTITVDGTSQVGVSGGPIGGATAILDMTGTAKLISGTSATNQFWDAIGVFAGCSATVKTQDTANITSFCGLVAGDSGGTANITLGRTGITADHPTLVVGGGVSTETIDDTFYLGKSGTGTLALNGSASYTQTTGNASIGGFNGQGTLNVNDSASVAVVAGNLSVGFNWGSNVEDQGTHTMTVSGSGAKVNVSGELILGADGGKGTFTQAAGQTTVVGVVILGEGDYHDSVRNALGDPTATPPLLPAHGNAVLNLNGGTITAPGMTTRSKVVSTFDPLEFLDPPDNTKPNPDYPGDLGAIRVNATYGTVNFNGGVLKAAASNADFIATDDALGNVTLNVLTLGAKIDTNGNDIALTKPLLGSTGDGGLTKLGSGTLLLRSAPTYNGNTDIQAGTLQLDIKGSATLSTVTGAGALSVCDGTSLTATSIVVDTLSIGGTPVVISGGAASVMAVPEPGTFVLLVLAGLGLVGAFMRRR
jgi:autotransporter-associated beta strand protein